MRISVAMILPYSSRKTFSSVSRACDMQPLRISAVPCVGTDINAEYAEIRRGPQSLRSCFRGRLDQWSHFDGARARGWDARRDCGCFVQILRFDQKVAT